MAAAVVSFAAGTTLGGLSILTLTFLFRGFRQPLPLELRLVLFAVFAFLAFAVDVGWLRFQIPQRKGMIEQSRFRSGRASKDFFLFGFELGTGCRTYLPSAIPHTVAVWVLLVVDSYSLVVLAAGGWGLARTLPLAGRLFGVDWGDVSGSLRRWVGALALVVSLALVAV